MSGDDDDGAVGYKKPPKKNRFKPKQSGNPKGRPRKAKHEPSKDSLADILTRVGNRTVEVNGEVFTLRELEILSLQTAAAKRDVNASRLLNQLRKEAGLMTAKSGGGVLVVPGMMPLDEWSAAAARQQAKFRGEDPEGLARLEEAAFGKKTPREDDTE